MRFGKMAADRPHFRWVRWATYGLLVLLWLGWQQAGLPRPAAWAQEEKLEDVTETPPATAPAAPAPSRAGAGGDAEVPSSLLDMFIDSGIIGYIITLLSVVAVGFIVEHAMTIRKNVLMPEQVVADVDNLIRQGQIDEALQYCQQPDNQSLFANVVLAGLERYRSSEFGFAEYKAAVEEEGEEQTSGLYRKTEVLGVIGAIAPMLGLLGTVQGMIMGFNKIASSGGSARPDELASSISLALVTTFEGLVVAIPTMVAFSFFRNRIDTLVAEAGKRVEQVLGPLGRRRT